MSDLIFVLLVAATAMNGLLAGASLDQSIKQLPARHQIGSAAYSSYSRAADLRNGIWWYATLGVGAALLTIAAAGVTYFSTVVQSQAIPIYMGGVLAILHSLATTQAAPTNFSQLRVPPHDEVALRAIFDKFEKWQTLRCVLNVVSFGVMLWTLVAYLR